MTRLTKHDIAGLDLALSLYDAELRQKTGASLREIACFAAGVSREQFIEAARECLVAVIPITTGQGLIEGFVQSVKGIVSYLGCRSVITCITDVAGLAEAVNLGADLTFMADDHKFIAFKIHTGSIIDNAKATARGYVAGISFMAEGVQGKDVLVLGTGRVGAEAVDFLLELGAKVAIFDPDPDKVKRYGLHARVIVESELKQNLSQFPLVIDASPQPSFIKPEDLHPEAIIAAPGIPIGLTREAVDIYAGRLIHDPLQIGVATMVAMALAGFSKVEGKKL